MRARTLRRAAALFIVAFAAPAVAFGQDFGFKAGANSASLTLKPANPVVNVGRQIGFAGGIFGTRQFTSMLSLETDVLFARKGAKSKTATGSSFAFDYILVPVMARLKVSGNSPVRMHLLGGPELGYRVRARLVNGLDSILWNDFVKVYDLGGTAGGNAEFGRFSFDIRYTRGLIDVSRNNPGQKVTNMTFTAMFGVALKRP